MNNKFYDKFVDVFVNELEDLIREVTENERIVHWQDFEKVMSLQNHLIDHDYRWTLVQSAVSNRHYTAELLEEMPELPKRIPRGFRFRPLRIVPECLTSVLVSGSVCQSCIDPNFLYEWITRNNFTGKFSLTTDGVYFEKAADALQFEFYRKLET